MTRLTPTLRRCLRAVDYLTLTEGVPPTIREVAELLEHQSTNGAHESLVRLRELGLLTWRPNQCRTMRLTPDGVAVAREQVAA